MFHATLPAAVVIMTAPAIDCPTGTEHRSNDAPPREEWCVDTTRHPYPSKHGPFIRWWKNGRLEATGGYYDDRLHGRIEYRNEEGSRATIRTYDKGVLDGPSGRIDLDNGVKLAESIYVNGAPDGIDATWHDDGRLATLFEWRHGKLQGRWEDWDEDGNLRNSGEYDEGVPVGTWTFRDEAGEPILRFECRDGNCVESVSGPGSPVELQDASDVDFLHVPVTTMFVRKKSPTLESCFDGSGGFEYRGDVRMKWTVTPDGAAGRFVLLDAGVGGDDVADCIASVVVRWHFPYLPYFHFFEATFRLRE